MRREKLLVSLQGEGNIFINKPIHIDMGNKTTEEVLAEIDNHESLITSQWNLGSEHKVVSYYIELDGREIKHETIKYFIQELDKINIPYQARVLWEKDC